MFPGSTPFSPSIYFRTVDLFSHPVIHRPLNMSKAILSSFLFMISPLLIRSAIMAAATHRTPLAELPLKPRAQRLILKLAPACAACTLRHQDSQGVAKTEYLDPVAM